MNDINYIVILGDSTSMSYGLDKNMYPFLLAENNKWPDNYMIINTSIPGMTAADSCALYFNYIKKTFKNVRGVIIYLGNCDTTSSEICKGRYTILKNIKNRLFVKNIKTSIKNRILNYEWNNQINVQIENPENPLDFSCNIERIIKDCKKKSICVILVRPKANVHFPSGIGKGNFVFYKYIGLNDNISKNIKVADNRLKNALNAHELKDYKLACNIYKTILVEPSITKMSNEYQCMITNNYAVAKAESGEYVEAVELLEVLTNETDSRKEIFLYNMAQIYKLKKDLNNYNKFLNESYENDTSLYRIRQPYITEIDKLKKKLNIDVLNMDEIIEDKMFLDWCHPLPEGQKLIAEKIMYIFNTNGVKGVNKSKLINKLYNPEYSMGNEMEFHKYYKSYSVSSEGDINEQIKKINIFLDNKIDYNSIDDKVNSISSDLKSSIEYYLKHPVITSINDILQYPPNNPVDIGRFPEYYIIKHIFPYLKIYENSNLSLPDIKLILLRSSDELISLLPKNNGLIVDSTELVIDENYESKRLPRIIAKVYKTLLSHLENGDQIYNRTKTSIYWYFRETLRFGSQSRISMRYDRITLEYISESLAVAYVLNNKLKSEYELKIYELIKRVNDTYNTHEKYCKIFDLRNNNSALISNYNKDLKLLKNTITENMKQ